MTTFKEIRGTAIQVLSSDPSNPEEGQIWYNSSSGTLKGYQYATVNAWSSGGNLNTGRSWLGGFGLQTAAVAFGGETTAPLTSTELYNGTTWTNNPTGKNTTIAYSGGVGTQTAGLAFGGLTTGDVNSNVTESFNGSTWTSLNNMVTGRNNMANFGIQTAAISATGATGLPLATYINTTESWNGSTWTSVPATVNTTRTALFNACSGTQTAGLIFNGYTNGGANTNATESYNGTSWTSVNTLNTTRRNAAGGKNGTQTSTLVFGGQAPPGTTGATELWNGTSWTTSPASLSTARYGLGGAGTQTSGLAFGGTPGTTSTEEWTGSANQVKTITVS